MSFLGIFLQGFQLEGSRLRTLREQPLLDEELDFGAEEGSIDVVLLLPQPGEEGARDHRRPPVDRRLQLLRLFKLADQFFFFLDQRGLQHTYIQSDIAKGVFLTSSSSSQVPRLRVARVFSVLARREERPRIREVIFST